MFNNPVGKSVLKDLREAFDRELLNTNPYVMAANVGARDVIKYIEERIGEYVHIENT